MAEKKTELSIILRTVDKATAGIRAVNAKLDAATKPIRDLGEAFGDLFDKSGANALGEALGGVGDAVGGILAKVGILVGLLAAATAGVISLIDGFDQLGDKAEHIGVDVDFLAQMRYAAKKSGAEIEQLDAGLQSFVSGLGQARAGTGKLAGFLKLVSPALLKQLKAAKSNAEAFDLLANAAAKIEDPAKRAAFAQKTLGDPALAGLLSKGADGVAKLREEYFQHAKSQKGAVAAAGAFGDSMDELHATMDGVKAALVEGLAPALTEIVNKLSEWLGGHRDDIKAWAVEIGKKIPAAFDALVSAVSSALEFLKPFFDSTTKIKIALGALVAVIVGPLIASLVSLGVAIMTTPIGWFMAAVAAIAAIVYEVYKHWDGITEFFSDLWDGVKAVFVAVAEWLGNLFLDYTPLGLIMKHWGSIADFFTGLWDGIKSTFQAAWDFISDIVDKVAAAVDKVKEGVDALTGSTMTPDQIRAQLQAQSVSGQANGIVGALRSTTTNETKLKVDFANAPKGTRVTADPQSTADVDLSVGYNMMAGAL